MTHYPEVNDVVNSSEGIHTLFIYVSEIVPIFIPLLLFSLFIIVFLGSFFASKRTGTGNAAASFAAAAYLTTIVAFFMSLIPNFINSSTVIITLMISILASLFLFFGSKNPL